MRDEWARPFEQLRLASPHSMPLLVADRLARHEREILGVMPPLARSGAGRVTVAGVKVPRLHHGEAEEVAHGPLPRDELARRARK
jgi:hypothetical protein